jgi:glycosyltransferase involved in cell wall biosynthesis
VTLTGELDEVPVNEWYARSDLFVLATLRETYGMAVAEAIARGLPIVSTRTGAIPEIVGPDAGILVAPGDAPALAAALRRVLDDRSLRERLAAGARRQRESLPTWDHAVGKMDAALRALAERV